MAEIRIERKRRGLGWLWLLLALIIVAVLAWYFLYPGRTTTAPATGAPPSTGARAQRGAPAAVALAASARAQLLDTRWNYSGGSYGQEG